MKNDPITTKAMLIGIGADIISRGLAKASAGNVSFRDPEDSSHIFVSETGVWLDSLSAESFVRLPIAARQTESGKQPSSEWRMHAMIYLMRPDVSCIIHAHPKYSTFMDAASLPIKFYTLDHAAYVKNYASSPFEPNGSWELAEGVAKSFVDTDIVVMSHHGAVVVGKEPKVTYRKLLNFEDAAEFSFMARLIGDDKMGFPVGVTQAVHL